MKATLKAISIMDMEKHLFIMANLDREWEVDLVFINNRYKDRANSSLLKLHTKESGNQINSMVMEY